jgi:hypothetical protein
MNTKMLFLLFATLSLNIHTEDNQVLESTLRDLSAPVKTTAAGFTSFLKDTFNHPDYIREILPYNLSHVAQFLEHGKKQPRAYAQSVLRLFCNKLKATTYINAYSFNALARELPSLLEGYFLVQRANTHALQEKINTLLFNNFMKKFSTIKTIDDASQINANNPLFNDIALEIIEVLSKEQEIADVSTEELRKTVLIFLETCLSKLVWSPEDQMDTWKSVKSISEQLAALMDCNVIIDFDDLNGLFVTLLERYCFFLDIAGSSLSATFYQEIKKDLATSSLLLLELEEQEQYIQPKLARLEQAIESARAQTCSKVVR